MTQLSDVPLALLRNDEDWLTGKLGGKGQILDVYAKPEGSTFQVYLHIKWDSGNESYPKYPEECTLITVDESYQHVMCKPYVEAKVAELGQHIEYFNRHTTP